MPTFMPDGLEIRDFEPHLHDSACKELEVTASQFQGFGGLIKAAIVHYHLFDAKPRQYSKHVLLVVVDTSTQGVVGVVAIGIKDLYVHGNVWRCGWVFDLRVSEAYQRRGIGAALTSAAEERASRLGVSYVYLSVNNDNRKARALYTAQGWTLASRRALVFRPLLLIPRPQRSHSLHVPVRALAPEEALKLVTNHFSAKDLSPTRDEMARLLASPNILGTFAAFDEQSGSHAALCLWHGSTLTAFKPVTLLVPFEWWQKAAPPIAIFIASAALYALHSTLCMDVGHALKASLLAVGAAAVGGALAFWSWARSRKAFRARAFAPCYSGPKWEPLMRAVYSHVAREARSQGFAVLVLNEDVDSPLVRCLHAKGQAPRSPTAFWQKALGAPVWSQSSSLPELHSDAFFDPRDM